MSLTYAILLSIASGHKMAATTTTTTATRVPVSDNYNRMVAGSVMICYTDAYKNKILWLIHMQEKEIIYIVITPVFEQPFCFGCRISINDPRHFLMYICLSEFLYFIFFNKEEMERSWVIVNYNCTLYSARLYISLAYSEWRDHHPLSNHVNRWRHYLCHVMVIKSIDVWLFGKIMFILNKNSGCIYIYIYIPLDYKTHLILWTKWL